MNRNLLSKLLVCGIVISVATPALNAAELSSEVLSDTTSEATTTSEVATASEATTSEATTSEATTSEATTSEATTSEVTDKDVKATGNDFFLDTPSRTDVAGTNKNVAQEITMDPKYTSSIKSGATITFTGNGCAFSNVKAYEVAGTTETALATSDYTFSGNTFTLNKDLADDSALKITYNTQVTSKTTDALGANQTGRYFIDKNSDGIKNGTDYYIDEVGYGIKASNAGITYTDVAVLDVTEIGGNVAVSNTGYTATYKNGALKGTATYNIKNNGNYALKTTSLVTSFDIEGKNGYYVSGPSYDNVSVTYSANGSKFMSGDALQNSFTSSAQEYFNPGQSVKVKVDFTITSDQMSTNLDKYNFGSYANMKKNSYAEFTVYTSYINNIFGEENDKATDKVVDTYLPTKHTTDTTDDKDTTDNKGTTDNKKHTTSKKTTSTKATTSKSTKADTKDYNQMSVTGKTSTLAKTGSTTTMTTMVLVGALLIAFVSKFKMATK